MICTYTISYVKMECKIWSFQTHDIDLVPQAMKQVTQGVNISHWHSDWLIVNLNLAIWPWNKKWMFPFQYTRCCQMVLKMYKTSDTSSQYLPMTHWLTDFELDHLCPMTLKQKSNVFLAWTYTLGCKYDHFCSLTIFAFQIEQQLKINFSCLDPEPTPCIGRLYAYWRVWWRQ